MKMRRFASVLLSMLMLGPAAFCQSGRSPQSPAADSPAPQTFDEIFAASINAMGGNEVLAKIHSITALAKCIGPRGNYSTEIHSARGDRLRFKQVTAAGEVFLGYVNGAHVWSRDENSGQFSILDKTHAAMFRGHEFQMMAMVLPARFTNPVVEGDEQFAGRRCRTIRVKNELDAVGRVYFDADSRLLAGFVIADPRSQQGETVRVVFDEWRRVDGAKLPSKVTATDRAGAWVLNFHRIELNQVAEDIFEIPQTILATQELLQLQRQARVAHFGRDAGLLVSTFADGFVNISAGKITRPTREQSRTRLQAYFDRSEFLEWDDISPPVVRVSQDASMAYVIVHKRVRLTARNEPGGAKEETTIFAWMETYEKQDGQWQLTAVASTNELPSQ